MNPGNLEMVAHYETIKALLGQAVMASERTCSLEQSSIVVAGEVHQEGENLRISRKSLISSWWRGEKLHRIDVLGRDLWATFRMINNDQSF